MTRIRHQLAALLSIFLMFTAARAIAATINLLPNGALDGPESADSAPAHWEKLPGPVDAAIATDAQEKHAGQSSARITAAAVTKSYIRSEPIDVAGGETIHGSAWVKVKDVPEGKGTVIMIAEFSDDVGGNDSVEKFNVANLAEASKGWTKIEGSVKVPPLATQLRVRLGFSYSMGTCWWDDVQITAPPLAIRFDSPGNRLSPAHGGVPVTMLNRNHNRGKETVHVSLDREKVSKEIALNDETTQKMVIPIKLPKPGKTKATIALGGAVSDERQLTIPPPLALGLPSPTHWVIEDGKSTIEGRVDIAMSDEQRAGATLTVTAGNGKWVSPAKTPLNDGITEFKFEVSDSRIGDYTLAAEVKSRSGKVLASAKQPWHIIHRRQAEVTINSAGYPEYDGKAIFPIGMFNGGRFKEQGAAGFTVTHAYNAPRIPDAARPDDENVLKWLDSGAENGMKMMLMVPMRHVIKGDWDVVRRRVRMFRNHPALLCWDEEEGIARGDFTPQTLPKLRKLIAEEDPHHPFMVGDARASVGQLGDRSNFFPPDDNFDMAMWWWYPFPMKQRAADALEGVEADSGAELKMPTFLTARNTQKPIWVAVQSYKYSSAAGRYPTPAEYRIQPYLAVIHGAHGVMWYGGSVTGGLFLNPDEGHWPELQKVVREFAELSPMWMSPSLDPPKVSDGSVSACIKRGGGRTLLVAANRSQKEIDVTIESPAIAAGKLTHHFEPLGVLIRDLK